ncbi:CorA metal ion transporter [Mortierella alpina]|nr:CorA metal ion transporter [Mortierella alpina]
MGDHRHLDGHPPPRDSGRPMTIDYAGLDASVTEAALMESGFLKTAFSESTTHGNDLKEGKGLNRAASTGSSGRFGPSSPDGSGFRRRSARKASFYSERAPRAPSMPQILSSATIQTREGSEIPTVFSDLLKDGCFWIDILDPSDFDMQILAKHFHVHPLTIEDISTEEVREKYEVFRHYYFVCFRTFDQDYNSGSYLQPASMYCVVFKDGIMTFHFRPTTHHLNVLRRMEQLQLHISLTPDWINYALLDDITDSFASPIQTIEYEVDSIDELVLLLRENETTDMLRRIGSCRKNVMAMSRLLANKADVVRGLMKRFDDRYAVAPLPSSSATAAATTTAAAAAALASHASNVNANANGNANQISSAEEYGTIFQNNHHRDGEILLYLGDILDHVLTMLQSLSSYEKILDRSHSNYLAQISLEINQLSNKTNEVVGTLTFFASLIVPMTFITGLWGMNIHVPGQAGAEPDATLDWWWGILGAMLLYTVVAILFGKRYSILDHSPTSGNMTEAHHFRILEFYSGIGGMHYAFNESGHLGNVLQAFDINTTANEVYAHNHGKRHLSQRNIEAVKMEFYDKYKADVWLMSPPCQPYTRTGNQEGSKDTRAKSFLYLMSILPKMQHPPNYLLLENVKGFEESDSRDLLVDCLTTAGYEFQELLITPLQIGIPNSRMRYYCLARKTNNVGSFVQPVTHTLIGYIPSLLAPESQDDQGQQQPSQAQKGFVDGRKQGDISGLSMPSVAAAKKRRTSLLTATVTKEDDEGATGKPDEDDILTDPMLALNVDKIEKFLEFRNVEDERMQKYMIPDKTLLKYGKTFDIVKETTRRSCCFTKGYYHFVESTGSILQMAHELDTASVFIEAEAMKAKPDSTNPEEENARALALLRTLHLRYFTENEVARLMGFPILEGKFSFPDTTSLKQRYRVLGNSINVKVVAKLIQYLLTSKPKEGQEAQEAQEAPLE